MKLSGRSEVEGEFAREITRNLRIPVIEKKLTVTAHGLRIIGIWLCYQRGVPLGNCACFVDLVEHEGKAKIKGLILRGAEGWEPLYRAEAA